MERLSALVAAAAIVFLAVVWMLARSAWADAAKLDRFPMVLLLAGGLIGVAFAVMGKIVTSRVGELRGPRSISPGTRKQIVTVLSRVADSPRRPRLWIGYQPDTGIEARQFAEAIAEAIHAAGWECWPSPPDQANEGRFSGVRLIAHVGPKDPALQSQHNRQREALVQVLSLLGQECQVYPNKSDDGAIGALIVGPAALRDGKPCVQKPDETDRFVDRQFAR